MARKRGGKGKAKASAKANAKKDAEELEDDGEMPEEEGGEEFEPVEDKKEDEEFKPVEEKGEDFEPVEEVPEEEFEPIEEGPPVEIKTSHMKVKRGEDEGYEPTIDEVLAYATGRTKRPSEAPPPRELKAPRKGPRGAKGKGIDKGDEDPLAGVFDDEK